MEVSIQPTSSSIILYPESIQESGSRVKGFIEFIVKNSCEVIDLRFRILGRKRIAKDALQALECESNDASKQFPETFFLQDIKLLDIHNGQEIKLDDIKTITKGRHIFGFDSKLPNSLPPTHNHSLSKVEYELILHIRGRPKGNFLKFPFMFTKSIPLLINVHPSLAGDKGLNNFHRLLNSQTNDEDIKLLVHSNNSRYGGCIDLSILHRIQGEQISITDLNVELLQSSIFRGQKLNKLGKQCSIGDISSIRSEKISQENIILDDQHSINSDSTMSKSATLVETQTEDMQRIEIKAWFPETKQSDSINHKESLTEWYPSTPFNTDDEIRFSHFIKVSFTCKNTNGKETNLTFESPLMLVAQDFCTAALQLPDYASATGCRKESTCLQ
jgi:ferredoxin-fold anticodon binding domain-containing protein